MLIVLYGCFVALLGKETFFRLNRIVLLSIIMSVLIIPALNITLPKPDYINIWDEELSYTPINTEPLNHIPLNIVDEESSAEATQMPLIPSEEQILIEYPEEPTPFPWQMPAQWWQSPGARVLYIERQMNGSSHRSTTHAGILFSYAPHKGKLKVHLQSLLHERRSAVCSCRIRAHSSSNLRIFPKTNGSITPQ